MGRLADFGIRALRDMWAGSLSAKDKKLIREAHASSCVYCGVPVRPAKGARGADLEAERFDHVQPVSERGLSVLGNIVLACKVCDDSRQHKPWERWAEETRRVESGDRIRDLDPGFIRQRLDAAKSYLKAKNCVLAFDSRWFHALPEKLRNRILKLELRVKDLDRKASEAARLIRLHLTQSDVHSNAAREPK